uniref:hypothetical protein n=1 Tax=Pseudophaeobacter profundi TaxID=3034152 RepID=UPI00242FF9CB
SFLLLDHLDDLFVRESRLHLSVLRLGGLYTKLEEIQGLRSLRPYLRSLFTDFLHCGAAKCGVGLQSVHYDRAPDFVDSG